MNFSKSSMKSLELSSNEMDNITKNKWANEIIGGLNLLTMVVVTALVGGVAIGVTLGSLSDLLTTVFLGLFSWMLLYFYCKNIIASMK